jgi:hypothetical protein
LENAADIAAGYRSECPEGIKVATKHKSSAIKLGAIILCAAVHYQNSAVHRCGDCQTNNKKGAEFSSFFNIATILALVQADNQRQQLLFFRLQISR